jgi:lysophospholipase L1-like esterase
MMAAGLFCMLMANEAANVPRSGMVRTNSNDLGIGNRAAVDRPFDGGIDEVRIWNVARTREQIQNDMHWELSGSEPGLVAYYKFNEGSGQSASDSTVYGNHGILGLSPQADASDPTWRTESGSVNIAPQVYAGADQSITWPSDTVNLSGTVSDDGLPAGILNIEWSKVSGPGGVVFGNAYSAQTTATFSTYGTYVLRLSADDTELTSSDDVSIIVQSGSPRQVRLGFDGFDDKLIVDFDQSLNIADAITLEAWIRPFKIPELGQPSRIISKPEHFELTLHSSFSGCGYGTSGDLQWQANIDGKKVIICGGELTLGRWYHISGSYDGKNLFLYIDGLPVTSRAQSGKLSTNTSYLFVGNYPMQNLAFHGEIDEVRIWNVARTQSQIQNNMNVELTGWEPGLRLYHPFNEGSGQIAYDRTPNGNDGFLGSSLEIDPDDPVWKSSDGYIGLGDSITKGSGDDITADGIGYEPILAQSLTIAKGYYNYVVNEGVSGHTASDGSARINSILTKYPEKIFFLIQYGTNDAKLEPVPRPSGLGLTASHPDYPGTFKDHIQRIINAILTDGRIPYLAKIPKAFGSREYMNPVIQEYNQVVDELHLENNIGVVPPDFYVFFENNPSQMADDLHPNGEGYQSMAREWKDAIINSGP